MNRVHVKFKAIHFYQYILGLFNKKILQRYDHIYIICKEYWHWTILNGFDDPVKML